VVPQTLNIYPLLANSGVQAYLRAYVTSKIALRDKLLKISANTSSEDPSDFVTKFMNLHEADPEKMTKMNIFTICQTNIGAGKAI